MQRLFDIINEIKNTQAINTELIEAIIGLISGAIGAILAVFGIPRILAEIRKSKTSSNLDNANAAKTVTESTTLLLEPLNSMIRALDVKIQELENTQKCNINRISELDTKVVLLTEDKKLLAGRIESLEKENTILKTTIRDLFGGINILITQLKKNNIEPEWIPSEPLYLEENKND